MNAEKFTQKAMEALQDARAAAVERDNSAITPEHLCCALVKQEGGLIPSLFKKMNVNTEEVRLGLENYLDGLPRVTGSTSGQIYFTRDCEKILGFAEKVASRLKDE